MTEDGQQIVVRTRDAKKQGSCRRPNGLQDGVIDVFDRLLEHYKRPPERFERKFQEFMPEYGVRLPRAPALRVVSAKRVSAISGRLYSGGRRCATSPPRKTTSASDDRRDTISSSNSKPRADAEPVAGGGANEDHEKTDSLPVTRRELNGTIWSKGEDKLYDIKTFKGKEIPLYNDKSEEKELHFKNEKSKDNEKRFNSGKSNDKRILCDNKDSNSRDIFHAFQETEEKDNEMPKKREVTKVGQATNRSRGRERIRETKAHPIHKQNYCEKRDSYEETVSDKNSDCNFSEPNVKMESISKKKFTRRNADANPANHESSSSNISNSNSPDLALIREILGQQRSDRSPGIKDKSIAKVQFDVDDNGVKSGVQTGESSTQYETKSRSSKNTQKVSRRPLNRPKRSTKLKLTKNEYMDMLMEEFILASKVNRIPPKSLMRELLRFSRDM